MHGSATVGGPHWLCTGSNRHTIPLISALPGTSARNMVGVPSSLQPGLQYLTYLSQVEFQVAWECWEHPHAWE